MQTRKFLALVAAHALVIAIPSGNCRAILPQSKAQIQSFVQDPNTVVPPTDIGSELDTQQTGVASVTQNLSIRNTTINARARTEAGTTAQSLKLFSSLSQSTPSDTTAGDGLGPTTFYSTTSAAEFRDLITVTTKREFESVIVHLVFKMNGTPLSALTASQGAAAVTSAQVQFAVDGQAVINETGDTNGNLGKFDGTEKTFDVSLPFTINSETNVSTKEVQLQILLYLAGNVSTFYACSTNADYFTGNAGLLLDRVYVVSENGNVPIDDAFVVGTSGIVYAGKAAGGLPGKYKGNSKALRLALEAQIDDSDSTSDDPSDDGSTDDSQNDDDTASFKLTVDGIKFSGVGVLNALDVGPMTFGVKHAKTLQLKKKGKPTYILSLAVKKKGEDDYQITAKVKIKGRSGSRSVTAKKTE